MMPPELGRLESAYLTHPTPVKRILKIAEKYSIPKDEALKLFNRA